LGYLSLPTDLARAAIASKWISDRGCPAILQHAVADLMESGAYDRHIRRMVRRNRVRRDALVSALQNHCGDDIEIEGADTGLHLMVRLRGLSSRGALRLTALCRSRGVGISSEARGVAVDADRVHGGHRSPSGLLLGYALLPVDRIEHGVRILAEAYREIVGRVTRRGRPDRVHRPRG